MWSHVLEAEEDVVGIEEIFRLDCSNIGERFVFSTIGVRKSAVDNTRRFDEVGWGWRVEIRTVDLIGLISRKIRRRGSWGVAVVDRGATRNGFGGTCVDMIC